MQWRTPPSPRARKSPAGFIVPCQPTLSNTVPTGPEWVHEIKHDGFCMLARKDGEKVRLWSRQGRSWTREFAAITAALKAFPVTQIVLDGEAVTHGPSAHRTRRSRRWRNRPRADATLRERGEAVFPRT